jgi:hypothetical protein
MFVQSCGCVGGTIMTGHGECGPLNVFICVALPQGLQVKTYLKPDP